MLWCFSDLLLSRNNSWGSDWQHSNLSSKWKDPLLFILFPSSSFPSSSSPYPPSPSPSPSPFLFFRQTRAHRWSMQDELCGSRVCVMGWVVSEGPVRDAGRRWAGMCLASGEAESGSRHSHCDHSSQRKPNLEGSLGDLRGWQESPGMSNTCRIHWRPLLLDSSSRHLAQATYQANPNLSLLDNILIPTSRKLVLL